MGTFLFLLIRAATVISGEHKHEPLPIIHGVEKAVISDAVSPGLIYSIPKLFDVLPDVGVLAQLWIRVGGELSLNARLLAAEILLEILLELRGLKDPELSQRACPSGVSRPGARPEASSSGACLR